MLTCLKEINLPFEVIETAQVITSHFIIVSVIPKGSRQEDLRHPGKRADRDSSGSCPVSRTVTVVKVGGGDIRHPLAVVHLKPPLSWELLAHIHQNFRWCVCRKIFDDTILSLIISCFGDLES